MSFKTTCDGCPHKNIPDIIKQKFNLYVQNSFDPDSCNDPNIYGCIMRERSLEWDSFIEWMKDGKLIEESELIESGIST